LRLDGECAMLTQRRGGRFGRRHRT